jgi:hypothetical protein
VDTIVCNINRTGNFKFYYNECCGGFNIANETGKFIIGTVIFSIQGQTNVLSETQKRTKIRNLFYDMSKKENLIQNISKSTATPTWVLQTKTSKIEKDSI